MLNVMNDMSARLFTSAAAAAFFCGVLPASAADPQLLNLVMPDAKVVAGINVQQALGTPFGQYVLSLIAPQDKQLQSLATLTGLDPRTDVTELLVASTGAPAHTGLALVRGTFDLTKIVPAAALAGAVTETYGGLTILEPKPPAAGTAATATPLPAPGLVFFDSTLAVMGDLTNVKAAIDRRGAASVLPAALITQVNQWSLNEDAWVVDIAPLSSLTPPAGAPKLPGGAQAAAIQSIQQAASGVKFGSTVVVTIQAQTDTAEDATALASLLQFVANLAQAQTNGNPADAALLKSLTVAAQGTTVNIGLSLPQAQIQQLVPPAGGTQSQRRPARKM
jgi:hypothetical protein